MERNYLEKPLKEEWLFQCERQARTKLNAFIYQLIESSGQADGIPDAFFIYKGHAGWLEFKRIADINTPIVSYRPRQLPTLRKYHLSGCFAATVGITSGMEFIIAAPPRQLLAMEASRFDLNGSRESVKGTIDAIEEALDWMLKNYYERRSK